MRDLLVRAMVLGERYTASCAGTAAGVGRVHLVRVYGRNRGGEDVKVILLPPF